MSVVGGPSQRLRLGVVAATGAAVAAGAGTAAGWVYWRSHFAFALVNIGMCAALVATGVLLARASSTRRSGLLLALAGFGWSANWLSSWDVAALPLLSVYGNSAFYLSLATGLLNYPDGRLVGLADRCWLLFALVVFIPGVTLLVIVSRPEWNGFAPTVFWPAPLENRAFFDGLVHFYTVLIVGVAVGFLILVVRRTRGLDRLERSVATPVLFAVGTIAVLLALLNPPVLTSARLSSIERTYALQGCAIGVVPLALLLAALRREVTAANVADRMLRASQPASVRGVRDSLRAVLRAPELDVFFWVPDQGRYVDVDGVPATVPDAGSPLWREWVGNPAGEPLAVLVGAPSLERHRPLVDAALRAGRLALSHAQLQAALAAQIVRTEQARQRVATAEAAERHRIARDLHDGVQQRILALAMTVSAVAPEPVTAGIAPGAEPGAEPAVGPAGAGGTVLRLVHDELLTINQEVRGLARGMRPEALEREGLGGALRLAAAGLRLELDLDVPERGFGDLAERTIYLAAAELLTNTAKHGGTSRARIRVRLTGGDAVAEVGDDGVGGASAPPGGGIAGLRDRVGAIGGTVELTSPAGAGTRVVVTVPCG
jgi:signal transduction histidine kinase